MDNLRKTLKILFQEQNPGKMFDEFINVGKTSLSSLDRKVNLKKEEKKNFVSCFNHKYSTLYNKDEVYNLTKILDKWMTLSSMKNKNIFNILVTFTQKVLEERNEVPICKHEKLFKWRDVSLNLGEDIFTTAFLAYNDVSIGKERKYFSWSSVIKTNNTKLQYILKKGMAENHFHLNGSSPHFQLAWISLMNRIEGREKQFNSLKKEKKLYPTKIVEYNDKEEDIEVLVKQAAIIRLFLYEKFFLKNKEIKFQKYYKELSFLGKPLQAKNIQNKISTIQYQAGKRFCNEIPDYAISKNITEKNYKINGIDNGNALLYGERIFLYEMFKLVFKEDKEFEPYMDLLYIYLCIKQRLRSEIIQINEVVGFANFADYQNRKELFIPEGSIYQNAIVNIAIRSSFLEQNIKLLETRITPKSSAKMLSNSILAIEKKVNMDIFSKEKSFLDKINKRENNYEDKHKYFHTLHFIKLIKELNTEEKDEKFKQYVEYIQPRNYQLRKKILKEASAINTLRISCSRAAEYIYGIDAANTEIGCRPEVFGQVFRFIKNFKDLKPSTNLGINYFKEIGQTFHAGEDFLDLIDGLRAIDEVLLFLNFSHGDRLGHALAMGINAKNYYKDKEYTIVISKQNLLDNIAWILGKRIEYKIDIPSWFLAKLETLFRKYFTEIYVGNIDSSMENVTIENYFESWKLRGDAPEPYLKLQKKEDKLATYSYSFLEKCRFNGNEAVNKARENKIARFLYREYHFNHKVKVKGNEIEEFKIEDIEEYINLVEKFQEALQKEVARKNIYIETNPSSNYLISPIRRYIEHPILKFNNLGLENGEKTHNLCVSINTDDQGVFATCLENEYALLALALLKERNENGENKYNQALIYEWIDRLREMSLEQSFFNSYN